MNSESANLLFLECIKKCKAGDRAAQKKLYLNNYLLGISVCLRYCKTKEEAEEIFNNGFLKVFKNIEKYNPSQSFKNWFKRILINASIDFYRSQKKHYYNQDINTAYSLSSTDQNAEGDLGEKDLMRAVMELPISFRTNFCLFAIDGYSHDEISKQLEISVGTSKSNVSRARNLLRKKLELISIRLNT